MAIPGAENKRWLSAQPTQDVYGTSSSVQGTLRMSKGRHARARRQGEELQNASF